MSRPVVVARRRPTFTPSPAPAPAPAPVAPAPVAPVLTGRKDPRFVAHHDTLESEHAIAPGRVTPPERFDVAGAWDMDDFASPAAAIGLDAANRLDPYWDGLWAAGSAASWLSIDLARRQSAAGLGRLPKALDLDSDAATERLFAPRGRTDRLALLSTLFSYRTVTAEQAGAITGDPAFARASTRTPADLFASGVVDLGVYSNGLVETDLAGRGAVYRPGKGDAFDEKIKDRLSWAEWVSVTGGQRWTAATNYDRHNILGTELALRLAEFTDVATVFGERFSSVDLLAGSGLGRPEMTGDQRSADLSAVRSDGLRIVFEMTANTGTHFNDKVRRWARLLAERPMETSGLVVVFVIIQHPERLSDDDGYIPRARTYQAIAAATKEFPGSTRDRVAARMGVATWREWFPARGKVHDAFFALRVDRPTGPPGDRLWEPADLLDVGGPLEVEFTPHDRDALTAVIDNSALLGQTPFWIRSRRDPDPVWPMLLSNNGLDAVPSPSPVRPGRAKGRGLGEGVGAARDAKPPRRLLGL